MHESVCFLKRKAIMLRGRFFFVSALTCSAVATAASTFLSTVNLFSECQPIPVVPRSSSSDELRVWRVTSAGLVEVDAKTMGAFLDKPKTDKTNVHGEGNVSF